MKISRLHRLWGRTPSVTLSKNIACSYVSHRNYADHTIPDHLKDMPTNKSPRFFDMVEYFFHKAWIVVEDKLVEDLGKKKGNKLTVEQRKKKVTGILSQLERCEAILELNFPLKRENGCYEIINALRTKHIAHLLPITGGVRYALTVSRDEVKSFVRPYDFKRC